LCLAQGATRVTFLSPSGRLAGVAGTCQSAIFHTVDIARQLIAMTKTRTGTKVTVEVLSEVYVTDKK
jgi:hypothetical protein